MHKIVPALIASLLVSGCATTYNPVPEGYAGPTATIRDGGFSESGSKAQFFVLQAIDGHHIENTLTATRLASHGQGFELTPRYITRQVPARPMKAKLVATHQTAAPIHELASRAAGTFFSVEGEVDFTPTAGVTYTVHGELRKEGSAVWIQNAETGERVTEKVAGTE